MASEKIKFLLKKMKEKKKRKLLEVELFMGKTVAVP